MSSSAADAMSEHLKAASQVRIRQSTKSRCVVTYHRDHHSFAVVLAGRIAEADVLVFAVGCFGTL